ncbi:UNVERIFIED_CONTAM: hypothetical protein Slati_3131400 [Sesamum latifolium]|uniref:DDE Tnp4 domain-containing protein n=1 Tax=Sesamum latifolium TaxID=2727402 RepID=A0AAW2UVZ1_9LAMI
MSRNAFGRLCLILETSVGLTATKHLTITEQVAIFLSVLAHHKKNCVVKHDFIRNGRTISKHFHSVLRAVLRVQPLLLARPSPISEDCEDPRKYYLCDNGYANGEGILTPYRGVRYHLKEWDRGGGGPQNAQELFNLRHAAARNIIECSFGLLQTRWGILRSPSYYSLDVQNKIVVACCLLHNYMNPLEEEGNSNPRLYRAKPDKTTTRRTWSQREEEALVNALRTICATGWRCENGFRAGGMVTVDSQDVWEKYCKVDPTAQTMRYKSWPFFPAWREIFGRDRADGGCILETINESVHPSKSQVGQTDTQECYVPTAEWCLEFGYVENDMAASEDIQVTQKPNMQSANSNRKSTSTSKKRKASKVGDDDGLSNVVSMFCESADARLTELSKKLFVDYIEVEKRVAVYEAVGKVPGVDLNDQIVISDKLVENSKKIDLFFSLPDEARARMVGLMLNGKVRPSFFTSTITNILNVSVVRTLFCCM